MLPGDAEVTHLFAQPCAHGRVDRNAVTKECQVQRADHRWHIRQDEGELRNISRQPGSQRDGDPPTRREDTPSADDDLLVGLEERGGGDRARHESCEMTHRLVDDRSGDAIAGVGGRDDIGSELPDRDPVQRLAGHRVGDVMHRWTRQAHRQLGGESRRGSRPVGSTDGRPDRLDADPVRATLVAEKPAETADPREPAASPDRDRDRARSRDQTDPALAQPTRSKRRQRVVLEDEDIGCRYELKDGLSGRRLRARQGKTSRDDGPAVDTSKGLTHCRAGSASRRVVRPVLPSMADRPATSNADDRPVGCRDHGDRRGLSGVDREKKPIHPAIIGSRPSC